jgi:hypothetical protein
MSEQKATNLYAAFETSKTVEKEGVYIKYGEKTKIRIARAGGSNTAFSLRYEVLMRPYRRLAQTNHMDKEVQAEIMRQLYAETVVRGWEGVNDRAGNELIFSVANCIQLFTDLPDLFDDVVNHSLNSALFREEIREEDAKN